MPSSLGFKLRHWIAPFNHSFFFSMILLSKILLVEFPFRPSFSWTSSYSNYINFELGLQLLRALILFLILRFFHGSFVKLIFLFNFLFFQGLKVNYYPSLSHAPFSTHSLPLCLNFSCFHTIGLRDGSGGIADYKRFSKKKKRKKKKGKRRRKKKRKDQTRN